MDDKVTSRAVIGMICGAVVGVMLAFLVARSSSAGDMAWGIPLNSFSSLAGIGVFAGLFIGAMIGGGLKGIYRKNELQ